MFPSLPLKSQVGTSLVLKVQRCRWAWTLVCDPLSLEFFIVLQVRANSDSMMELFL